MLKYFNVIIIHVLLIHSLYSQKFSQRLEPLIDTYKSFDYQSTIDLAYSLIGDSVGLNKTDLCEIHRLKALSYYSLLNMQGALHSFVAILKINPDYTLNPEQNSPKIISYFEEIRINFLSTKAKYEPEKMTQDSLQTTQKIDSIASNNSFSNKTMLYSILLPGLGHITTDPSPKGWLLCSAGMLMLGSSIYYIIDTNRKERDYLNTIDKSEIERKYVDYNTSYKRRNFLIFAYAALWLYSQIDIFFFSQNKNYEEPIIAIGMDMYQPYQQMITIRIKL